MCLSCSFLAKRVTTSVKYIYNQSVHANILLDLQTGDLCILVLEKSTICVEFVLRYSVTSLIRLAMLTVAFLQCALVSSINTNAASSKSQGMYLPQQIEGRPFLGSDFL